MTGDHDTITLKDAAQHFGFTVSTLRAEADRILALPIVADPVEGSALRGPLWYKQAFIDLVRLINSADSMGSTESESALPPLPESAY